MITDTEQESVYKNLDQLPTMALLEGINNLDQTVALAVKQALPAIAALSQQMLEQLRGGGRVFYIGAGTSGRLGVLDASECPPTFGVAPTLIQGIIAGGDMALRQAIEHAEDQVETAWQSLVQQEINRQDILIGLSASGSTAYVLGALSEAKRLGIPTGCIVCNPNSPIATACDFPITVLTGPEFLTGSTRMKAGTAQKMVLNMLSTTVMIQLGKVQGNKMVDMRISNAKLKQRAIRIVMDETGCPMHEAEQAIEKHQSIRLALQALSRQTQL